MGYPSMDVAVPDGGYYKVELLESNGWSVANTFRGMAGAWVRINGVTEAFKFSNDSMEPVELRIRNTSGYPVYLEGVDCGKVLLKELDGCEYKLKLAPGNEYKYWALSADETKAMRSRSFKATLTCSGINVSFQDVRYIDGSSGLDYDPRGTLGRRDHARDTSAGGGYDFGSLDWYARLNTFEDKEYVFNFEDRGYGDGTFWIWLEDGKTTTGKRWLGNSPNNYIKALESGVEAAWFGLYDKFEKPDPSKRLGYYELEEGPRNVYISMKEILIQVYSGKSVGKHIWSWITYRDGEVVPFKLTIKK